MAKIIKTISIAKVASELGGVTIRDTAGKVRAVIVGGVRYSETGANTLQSLRAEYTRRTGVETQSIERSVANRTIAQTKEARIPFKNPAYRTWDKEIRRKYLQLQREIRKGAKGETSVKQINAKLKYEKPEAILGQLANRVRHAQGIAYVGNVEALIASIDRLRYEQGTDNSDLVDRIINYLESVKDNFPDKTLVEAYQILYEKTTARSRAQKIIIVLGI